MSYELQNAFRIPGRLAAEDTKPGTHIFAKRGLRAPCAELLDINREAM
jgi:hypothetical protein